MKKGFTLLEVVISITIFLIILIALYQVLDNSRVSNTKLNKTLFKNENSNQLYDIVIEDIAEAQKGTLVFTVDNDQNSIVTFTSHNSYHDPFYVYKTYLVSAKKNLVRIESKTPFVKDILNDQFFDNSFIDVLASDIEKFQLIKKGYQNIFVIKQKGKEQIELSALQGIRE